MSRRRIMQYTCDGCGATSESCRPNGWLMVLSASDLQDFQVEGFDTYDFCSFDCLATFAAERGQKVASPVHRIGR